MATWASIVHAIISFARTIAESVRDELSTLSFAIKRGWQRIVSFWQRVGTGLSGLFGQIGSDIVTRIQIVEFTIKSVFISLKKSLVNLGLAVTAPLRALVSRSSATIRRPFAKAARENALGMPVTSDDESHRELILFLGLLGVLVAVGGWYAVAQSGVGASGIDFAALLKRVAGFSPEKMTIFASLLVATAFAVWFWVHMLLDSFGRDFETETAKTKWRLIASLLFVPGAIAYFFKVYNQWSFRQFMGYHVLSVLVACIAVLVTTSTSGALWYFNQKASAQLTAGEMYKTPNLELDQNSKNAVLGRTKYGAPLTPNTSGGRIDPFAPIPGQETVLASPSPSPSPSPSASPASSSEGVPVVTRP